MAHNLDRWTARIGLGERVVITTKTLRQRIFSLAGRITRKARRLALHLPQGWPWQYQYSSALAQLRALPLPSRCRPQRLTCPPSHSTPGPAASGWSPGGLRLRFVLKIAPGATTTGRQLLPGVAATIRIVNFNGIRSAPGRSLTPLPSSDRRRHIPSVNSGLEKVEPERLGGVRCRGGGYW